MLRRLPTAISIASEDITAFEESFHRRVAYIHFKKTGEDPEGLFTGPNAGAGPVAGLDSSDGGRQENRKQKEVDPNDELKPLPGDKARIVRGREERIMGAGR